MIYIATLRKKEQLKVLQCCMLALYPAWDSGLSKDFLSGQSDKSSGEVRDNTALRRANASRWFQEDFRPIL